MTGYRYTDTGNFDVSLYPTNDKSDHDGMIIVDHVLGKKQTYGPPEDINDFWDKNPDEIIDIAVKVYVNSIDWEDSENLAADQIVTDALNMGIDLDTKKGGDNHD